MQNVLWTFLSIAAYIVGLVVVVKLTPRLFVHTFDDGVFMGIAAAAIVGALGAFGAVVITFALFNGHPVVRVLNFLLLLGILIVGIQVSLKSFRPRMIGSTVAVSRFLAGGFAVFLIVAAVSLMVRLFVG
jgi:hypothetical protein